MMHRGYGIGIFLAFFLIGAAYVAAYHLSLENEQKTSSIKTRETNQIQEKQAEAVFEKEISPRYWLMEEDGAVMVYLSNGRTMYERTEISVDNLPLPLKEEIAKGKEIWTEQELYGFLENYSS
ncbi:MAG: hypothetical protein V8S12_03810 [Lachnospiraceae bacterium]